VVLLTLLYNIPKFFELYVKEEYTKTCFNGTDAYNVTYDVQGPSLNDSNCENGTLIMVKPTKKPLKLPNF
jgi:hypothetical protein